MGKLTEESKLYVELSRKYEEEKGNISLSLFNECVDIALKSNKREIQFVLFNLRYLYGDVDTRFEQVNKMTKQIKTLAGDNLKAVFMISVLETTLNE